MCNVQLEDKVTAKFFRTRLKMNDMEESSQDRRVACFGRLGRI